MARLVQQVSLSAESINPLESAPYFLAVDQPSSACTQRDLIQTIVDEMGEHYDVPRKPYEEAWMSRLHLLCGILTTHKMQ